MRFHAFELNEPLPKLNNPHAIVIIRPWIDVSNVGSLVLSCFEHDLSAKQLAKFARPGNFFNFTQYRPTVLMKDDVRELVVPNTVISYGRINSNHDFLTLRLLEPHMLAESYIDSVVELLKALGIKRYCLVGSMYDLVPYTRPLLVTGAASTPSLQKELALTKVVRSNYSGITTILSLIEQKVLQMGVETCSMIVHLPSYFAMEDDYRGERRLMEIMHFLYEITLPQEDADKANQQENQLRQVAEQFVEREPRYKLILKQLEADYDSRIEENHLESRLSPEDEQFLQNLNKRFKPE